MYNWCKLQTPGYQPVFKYLDQSLTQVHVLKCHHDGEISDKYHRISFSVIYVYVSLWFSAYRLNVFPWRELFRISNHHSLPTRIKFSSYLGCSWLHEEISRYLARQQYANSSQKSISGSLVVPITKSTNVSLEWFQTMITHVLLTCHSEHEEVACCHASGWQSAGHVIKHSGDRERKIF